MPTTKLSLPTITDNMTADVVRDMNALANEVDAKFNVPGGFAPLGSDGKVAADKVNIDLSNLATKQEVQGVNNNLTAHKGENASLITKGHVQLSSSTDSLDESKAATPKAVKSAMDATSKATQSLTTHKNEEMPHVFTDNGVKYRWGFRAVNGEPQMIYEEVTS